MFKISIIISRRDLAAAITHAAFVNRTFDYTNRSVIERSIGFDWQNFIVSSIMFD